MRVPARYVRFALILGAAWPALLALLVALADRSRGGPLASFPVEYAGGGSCELRLGAAFEALLLLGLTGFPVALVVAAICAFRRAWLGAAAALAGALALGMLGFVRPALGLCPPMRVGWTLTVMALMATACARAPAEHRGALGAPRMALELARIDDSIDVFAGLAAETLPHGIVVSSEEVPLGPGAGRTGHFARLELGDGESREAAIPRFRAWLAATVRLPPDARIAFADVGEADRHGHFTRAALRTFVVVGAPFVSTKDLLDAVAKRSLDDGHAYVALILSPGGMERQEAATDAWLGRRMAIMIDGRVMSAPVIDARLSSRNVTITMGAGDPVERMAEATKLAQGLAVPR